MFQTKTLETGKTIIEQSTILSSRLSCIIVLRNFSFFSNSDIDGENPFGKTHVGKNKCFQKVRFTTLLKHFYIIHLDILLSLFVGEKHEDER